MFLSFGLNKKLKGKFLHLSISITSVDILGSDILGVVTCPFDHHIGFLILNSHKTAISYALPVPRFFISKFSLFPSNEKFVI